MSRIHVTKQREVPLNRYESHFLRERLKNDIEAKYGDRISIKHLARLFYFNSYEGVIRAIQLGHFPLTLHGGGAIGDKHVLTCDVVSYLFAQHLKYKNETQ